MFDVQVSETEVYRESDGYRPGETAVMAQTRTGKTWHELFDGVRGDLGLSDPDQYFATLPAVARKPPPMIPSSLQSQGGVMSKSNVYNCSSCVPGLENDATTAKTVLAQGKKHFAL